MDQNHISGVLKHNAQFFAPLPQHIYPCCLPIVYVQLRLQIKGRNTDKKQVWKGGKYDICIFGTREKNELGSFPKVVQLRSQSGLRCGPLFLAAHPYLFHQVPLIFTLTNKLHPQFQVAIASSYFTPLLLCQPILFAYFIIAITPNGWCLKTLSNSFLENFTLGVCFHQFLCFISHPFQPMTPHTIYTSLTYILFLPNADKQDCKKNFNIFLFQKAYDKKANVKAISIKRSPWNLGYKPMTVITCSLDFPEFQTWLHNDWGGVLPVAITGQVQPPGDLDQSRSDRHNSIGIWRETNPSLVCDSASSTRWEESSGRARGEATLPAPQSSSPLIILQTLQLLLRLLPPPPLEPAGP